MSAKTFAPVPAAAVSVLVVAASAAGLSAAPATPEPGAAPAPSAAAVAETHPLYVGGADARQRLVPWSMKLEERTGGPDGARYLWLNGDCQALPWAGLTIRHQEGDTWALTPAWLENGFVHFLVAGGLDRYGTPIGRLDLQLRPECDGAEYQHLESRFVDRGRGISEDPGTWQEVLVPLRFWADLKPGAVVRGLSVQCVARPTRSFGLTEVTFTRFHRPPAWTADTATGSVSQPWVTWPPYARLPEVLRADRHPPRVKQGRFVNSDGRRVFLLNAWLMEDHRLDFWGTHDGRLPPDHGLFDPKQHGWIYNELPNQKALCRLGFNSLAVCVVPEPFWRAVGYQPSEASGAAQDLLADTVRRVGLPLCVDNTCFEWTLGAPALHAQQTELPTDAMTQGPNHWVPYRIIGPGREVWLRMWRLTAERYRKAGARVLVFELFNEPAYQDVGVAHRREFVQWLRERYHTLGRVNAAWRTRFASWDEAAAFDSESALRQIPGRWLDYDDYLAGRFADLVSNGVAAVKAILPDALVGVQPMSGYALEPREAIWEPRLAARTGIVITPTGGGHWSPGASASRPAGSLMAHPMAGAPIENDLLLALAGPRMIVDGETYLSGQTARDTRNRLWKHVIVGLDGLSLFAWSRRGWSWWRDRQALVTEADRFPYSALIPLVRRTAALRGILDFAAEVQPLAERILPKPWGPAPRIGLLYSWPQARRRAVEPSLRDKTPYYHAALRYSHWNAAIVPSDRCLASNGLAGLDVVIAGGIRVVEPGLPARLASFVRSGGVLVVAEEALAEDLYGRPVDSARHLGVHFGPWEGPRATVVPLPATPLAGAIRGALHALPDVRPVEMIGGLPIVRTADGQALVVRRRLGRGFVYAVAADLAGYPLAKLLCAVLEDAAHARGGASVPSDWRAAEVRTTDGGLAPNVLVSRRPHRGHHAILLLNGDDYRKTVRLKLPGLTVPWLATEALSQTRLTARHGWYTVTLEPGGPAVVLLTARSSVAGPGAKGRAWHAQGLSAGRGGPGRSGLSRRRTGVAMPHRAALHLPAEGNR